MSTTQCDFQTAYNQIKKFRNVVSINRGFEMQLTAYYNAGFDVFRAEQMLLLGRINMLHDIYTKNVFKNLRKSDDADKTKYIIDTTDKVDNIQSHADKEMSLEPNAPNKHKRSLSLTPRSNINDNECNNENIHHNSNSDSNTHETHTPVAVNRNDCKMPANNSSSNRNLSPFAVQIRKYIPLLDARTPQIRLSRPRSQSIRVIPPLRGLESCYSCSW